MTVPPLSNDVRKLVADLDGEFLGSMISGMLLTRGHGIDRRRLAALSRWGSLLAAGTTRPSARRVADLADLAAAGSAPDRRASFEPGPFALHLLGDLHAMPEEIHAGAAYTLQRLLTHVDEMGIDADRLAPVVNVLRIGDAIAARSEGWNGAAGTALPDPSALSDDEWLRRGAATLFSAADLAAARVDVDEIAAFIRPPARPPLDGVARHAVEADDAMRPLARWGDGIRVPVPAMLFDLARDLLVSVAGADSAADYHLAAFARWTLFDLPRGGGRPVPTAEVAVTGPDWSPWFADSGVVASFDEDKLAHLLVLRACWDERHPSPDDRRGVFDAVRDSVAQIRDQIAGGDPDAAGLTLIVVDAPDPIAIERQAHLGPRWFAATFSSHEFSLLTAAPDFSLLDLWKMYDELGNLQRAGALIHMDPDPLTAWSLWRSLGSAFDFPEVDMRRTALVVEAGPVAAFAADVRSIRGARFLPWPEGGHRPVERLVEADASAVEARKPVFHQPLDLVSGHPVAAVETRFGPWWVRLGRPPTSAEERHFLSLLYQAALEWLVLASACAPASLPGRDGPVLIALLPVPDRIQDGPSAALLHSHPSRREARVVLPAGLMARMIRVDNAAEVETLGWLLEAVLRARGAGDPRLAASWAGRALADPDLKMIHVTQERDPGCVADMAERKTAFRPLQKHDLAAALRGMDVRLAEKGAVRDTRPIEGRKAICALLRHAVDLCWDACRARLGQLDRASMVALALRAIEGVHRRRVEDERAARARRVAFADDPELSARLTGQRDEAFRAYRVLVEMAVCAAPAEGGRTASLADLDHVAAQIAHLVRLADFSDRVARGLVRGRVAFSLNGTLLLGASPDRADPSTGAYLRACLDDVVSLDREHYGTLFGASRWQADPTQPEGSAAFEDAVASEYGVSLLALLTVSVALQEAATGEVAVMRRSRLVEAAVAWSRQGPTPVTAEQASAVVDAFSLRPRPLWSEAPPGFEPADTYPWLFERRLSLMTRPLVALSGEPDPDVAFGVRQVRMGFDYPLLLLEHGIWQPSRLRSDAARGYVDAVVQRRGRDFEVETARAFEAAGWQAMRSLAMPRLGAPETLGDVDVLGVSPDGATWVVTECKWFGSARTSREIANWLKDFKGGASPKPDKLDRHLNRYRWVRRNALDAAVRLGLGPPSRVLSRIVTKRRVPLAFVSTLPESTVVLTADELAADLRARSPDAMPASRPGDGR